MFSALAFDSAKVFFMRAAMEKKTSIKERKRDIPESYVHLSLFNKYN